MTLHFFYHRSPYGSWMPVTSYAHPEEHTRDGHKVAFTGHVALTPEDALLPLSDLAMRFPVPVTDTAESSIETVEIRVPVSLAREVLNWMDDEMAQAPEDTAYQRDLAAAKSDLLAEIERLDRAGVRDV